MNGSIPNKFTVMAKVSIYLNFQRSTEEAFNYYRNVFGGDFPGGIMRFSDIPVSGNMPELPEEDKNLVMHVALPVLGDMILMGSDAPESMGFQITSGNNVYINLQPDTRIETQKLFGALSDGGVVEQELQDMFWGDYYGSCRDRFGVQWMFNCSEKNSDSGG
jgi:PhnB protein